MLRARIGAILAWVRKRGYTGRLITSFHQGIDYGAACGISAQAVEAGTITTVEGPSFPDGRGFFLREDDYPLITQDEELA